MLTRELRALGRDGIIVREQFPEIPPKVVYKLTILGETLKSIISSNDKWRTINFKAVKKSREVYDKTSSK